MKLSLQGVVAATFTPMGADRALALERVPAYVERLLDDGLCALYVLGSTGEGASLTSAERRSTAEAFLDAVAERVPVIVQVGHNSLREARELAAHAQGSGASAVSMTAPSYFKPPDADALASCVAEVAAGAPELPMVYYDIPALTGVSVDPVLLLERAREQIPTLGAVKFTSPRIDHLQALLAAAKDDVCVLFGCDEMLLAARAAGALAAVGSTYNFAAPLYQRVLEAFERGELEAARREQARAVTMVHAILAHGGNAAIKACMAISGCDLGPVRLPQVDPSRAQRAALARALTELGFFEWARPDAEKL